MEVVFLFVCFLSVQSVLLARGLVLTGKRLNKPFPSHFSFSVFFCTPVDQIYHLASPASPPNYMYNPIKTLKTNTIGTLNMLGKYHSQIKSMSEISVPPLKICSTKTMML